MMLQIEDVRQSILGEGAAIPGPFGARALIYADYVASGRSLSFVEDAIRRHVLPFYGNTHTETSFTGRRSTQLREMARKAVRRAVAADEGHAVIFAGSGTTAAADKLLRALVMQGLDERSVILVGPYEHHSNDLPWRESGARLVRIPMDAAGGICLETLERAAAEHADAPMLIGAFSAASNVTGLRSDIRAVARILHRHGGWFVCDYAAAAPYIPVNLSETTPGAGDRVDVAFISPHKYPGGPGASGLLVVDRRLLETDRPTMTGGGTVSYVTEGGHTYVSDPERREEAGTPSIVENIRAGMVLQLKSDIGDAEVEAQEMRMAAHLDKALRAIPGVEVLGPAEMPRIGIFSFNIRVGGRLLHHNYVVALLNDLFGIQARGGCSCAGPYGHSLLGIDAETSARHQDAVARGLSAFRPGWARLGVNYFFTLRDVDKIVCAIEFIARHGLALLPRYRLDLAAGVWRALPPVADAPPDSLSELWQIAAPRIGEAVPGFEDCLQQALALACQRPAGMPDPVALEPGDEALRWFWLPDEAVKALDDMAGAA